MATIPKHVVLIIQSNNKAEEIILIISILVRREERRKNDEGMIMIIEEEEIKWKNKKTERKKHKNTKSITVSRIEGLGKIVPKQISWRLVAVFCKVCFAYDLFEFTNFAF